MRTLVVTNDFPTRQGGIEAFVLALCQRLPASDLAVYTASMPGDREFDATLPFPVVRDPTSMLVPSPRVRRRVLDAFAEYGCDRAMFGAVVPLGLLAEPLRHAGAERTVGITHGHETWWARLPGPRQVLRRIGDVNDTLTYHSGYIRDVLSSALSPTAAQRLVRLAPGVDTAEFQADSGGAEVRRRHGVPADAPVVVCVARLTPRKGQDTLIRAWPQVTRSVPGARLLIVGKGPHRAALERLSDQLGMRDHVVFTGPVPWAEVPPYFDAGDVFACPCRTRLGGLEPEGLGIVFLEAQASGLPVIVGDSGGAPDTVRHGETGFVVDPYNSVAVATKTAELLADREWAQAMGKTGRDWVAAEWTWESSIARLRGVLGYPEPGTDDG